MTPLDHWFAWAVIPAVGFVGMISGGYWGIGCSWLIVPVLLLLGATPMEAAGAALIQMVPSILPVVVRDAPALGWRSGKLGRSLILPLGLAGVVGAWFGRTANLFLYRHFDAVAFQCIFAAVMVYLGSRIFFGTPENYGRELPRFGPEDAPGACAAGLLSGTLSSLLGIGGGMFFRPVLAGYYKIPEKETGNAVRLLLLLTSLAGGVAYMTGGDGLQWHIPAIAGLFAVGGMAGFPIGVKLHRIVVANNYSTHIHRSFAVIAWLVAVNLLLTVAGFRGVGRIAMIAVALLLTGYLFCFAHFAAKHPRNQS